MTNCGRVYDVRKPMVGVQTPAGQMYIPLDQLRGPSSGCRIVNGQYVP